MAALIGTREHARRVFELHHGSPGTRLGDDWQDVGGGGCRHVYLHEPTSVVYKVQQSYNSWIEDYGNDVELRNARALRRLEERGLIGKYVSIPKTSGFRFKDGPDSRLIVAMQYIQGIIGWDARSRPEARKELFSLGLADMHGYNYIMDETGRLWPIDMGSTRYRFKSPYADKRALGSARKNV